MQNQLYNRFSPLMFAVCLRYSGNRQDAQEILQEGFIKVFSCLHQYKFTGPLEAWIKRIMVNCALQKFRSRNLLYTVAGNEKICEEIIDDELILDNLNVKELIRLIQGLPFMCRLVFNLYVFENMKHREIAKMLSISEGTSKSNLHDARMLLQKQLNPENLIVKLIRVHE